MGQEISRRQFSRADFDSFVEKLAKETALLGSWVDHNKILASNQLCGFEIEGWLTSKNGTPLAENEAFIKNCHSKLVFPELSKFNFELNAEPLKIAPNAFLSLHQELNQTWTDCINSADEIGAIPVLIGILPTASINDLTLANISEQNRYYALNQEILALRKGKPFKVHIEGNDVFSYEAKSVMLESATTSLQIHLQLDPKNAVRFYNAAVIASAIMVAISANSPYFAGYDLWDETRIPLFKQSVSVEGFTGTYGNHIERVTLGNDYLRHSVMEIFNENKEHFEPVLPTQLNEDIERLACLRMHNGSIWRWNRLLLGFDEGNKHPHIRLEHRVCASGPSIPDMIANIVFFVGLVHYLAEDPTPPEELLLFTEARDNFFAASRHSLNATIHWLDGKAHAMDDLILTQLVPRIKDALLKKGLSSNEVTNYIDDIIVPRVTIKQHGAQWQRRYIHKHGKDFNQMVNAYIQHQASQLPVHEWDV